MKVINIRPDANGMINWPTLSAQRKAIVTIGVFDGMHPVSYTHLTLPTTERV